MKNLFCRLLTKVLRTVRANGMLEYWVLNFSIHYSIIPSFRYSSL